MSIPGDISEDISRWSVIAMHRGCRGRTIKIYKNDLLETAVLHPLDFVISKLRRFSEEDIEDALFAAKNFNISDQAKTSASHQWIPYETQ